MEQAEVPVTPPAAPMGGVPAQPPGTHPIELWISYVLRVGTTLAGAIILAGVALFLIQGPQGGEPVTLHDMIGGGGHSVATSWQDVFRGVAHGRAFDVIRLGLLVLILTPTTRVAMTVALFIAERDRAFIVATTIVLIILILGLIGIS